MESSIQKSINENENHPDYTFHVVVDFNSDNKKWGEPTRILFYDQFMLGDLTNVNILQNIKLGIKEKTWKSTLSLFIQQQTY